MISFLLPVWSGLRPGASALGIDVVTYHVHRPKPRRSSPFLDFLVSARCSCILIHSRSLSVFLPYSTLHHCIGQFLVTLSSEYLLHCILPAVITHMSTTALFCTSPSYLLFYSVVTRWLLHRQVSHLNPSREKRKKQRPPWGLCPVI